MPTKTKIVLDSDVLIHFIKADCVFVLLNIFPELLVSAKTFKPYLAFYFPRTADILNV